MFLFESVEGVFALVGGLVFAITAFSWIAFARLSMARIEQAIIRDGGERPAPWDGIGMRTVWYAWAIAVPVGHWNWRDDPTIDVPKVRSHATRFDRVLGASLLISGNFLAILSMFGGVVLGFY